MLTIKRSIVASLVSGTLFAAMPAKSAELIHINKFPDDVPCTAVKKNADGSWTQTKDVALGGVKMGSNTFQPQTNIAQYWDKKCAK